MILNKNKKTEHEGKVIFINAEDEFETGRKQNYLRKIDIEKIIKTVDAFQSVSRYAEVVTNEQIAKKDYFLNIRRYVDASKVEPTVDLHKLNTEN